MKGKELLMLVAILGVGLWAITRYVEGPGSTASSILAPIITRFGAGPAAHDVPKPDTKEEGKKGHAKAKRSKASGTANTDSAFPDEPSTITVLVPSAHYPTPEELKIGSTGTDIRSQFGEPSARVAGVRDGFLLERYYYLNSDRTRVTIATLRNGLLVSAQSQSR
jgi:hypothetical protein